MDIHSILLIADVAVAFCLCYFIIRFIGSALQARPEAPDRSRNNTDRMGAELFRRITKALFGVSGDELFSKEDKSAFLDTGKDNNERWLPDLRDLVRMVVIIFIAALVGYAVDRFIASEAAVISVFMLAVLIVALGAERKLTGPIASLLSLIIYDFFFIEPRLQFVTYGRAYSFIFILMCIVSVLAGTLTQRLKVNVREASAAARRSRLLFETNQLMQRAGDAEEILSAYAQQLRKLVSETVIIYPAASEKLGAAKTFPLSENMVVRDTGAFGHEDELAADWAFRYNDFAGKGTERYPDAMCTYIPIGVNDKVYGVAGVLSESGAGAQRGILKDNGAILAITGECALALENDENRRRKEASDLLAKNEQLRANILRTVSHDLRTPLTSIYGNASNLLNNEEALDKATRRQMYEDICDDSVWLTGLVENMLYITRIEDKRMKLELRDELVDEVIGEAVKRFARKNDDHVIRIEQEDEFIFARMDARLIVQVLINLINNAVKYTPKGSEIIISARRKEGRVELCVADNGPGISDEEKPRVFRMFYSGGDSTGHGARSTGLGLYLCKAIVNAHGSELRLTDNIPHGAVFSFDLMAGEVDIHG